MDNTAGGGWKKISNKRGMWKCWFNFYFRSSRLAQEVLAVCTSWICSCLKWSQSSSFSIPMTDNLISKRWSKSFLPRLCKSTASIITTINITSVRSLSGSPTHLLFQVWLRLELENRRSQKLCINTAILHFHFHWNHAWTTCQLVKALVKLVSLVTRFKSGLVISILSASRKSPFLQVLSWAELRIMDRI